MHAVLLASALAVLPLWSASAREAGARTCGEPCQRCVEQLHVPRDARGSPMFGSVDRQDFQFCLRRERGSTGKNKSAR